MPWRNRAQSFRKRQDELYASLTEEALTGKGSEMHTWASVFASTDKPEGDQRRALKPFAGAAIETTAGSLQAFVLACIRYPDWIIAAQKELDDIVGVDRLPTFKDRPFLPFMEAVVRGMDFPRH
ncbi:hypothetical protein H0H93_014463 [Arthromyces matolae]|nr:hypothetical protein H0H93_014463 [Arthromyces matolae]